VEPSDLGPVLQYGSGPSSDFQTKILGVNTPLFLFNMPLFFSRYSLLVLNLRSGGAVFGLSAVAQLVPCSLTLQTAAVRSPVK
jgi:hypothetical protein